MERTQGMGQLGPRRWLGANVRLLATLFFLLLIVFMGRCGGPTEPAAATPTAVASVALLRVEVNPYGATILVDGEPAGKTPAVLELVPGQYAIQVELEGYEPLNQTMVLVAGDQVAMSGDLVSVLSPLAPTVTLIPDSGQLAAPTLPATRTSPPAEPPTATSMPSVEPLPTVAPSPSPSPATTVTPSPPPPPPTAAVTVREGQIPIPTYPFASFVTQAWNSTFHMPYAVLDRSAYDASNPQPAKVIYRTLMLENEYLKLTFLPDLGGRLYEVIYKPTGHRETYRNPVLKPSPWGPPEQGWWLAAGGIEWCLPVEEHGYEWGVPWLVEVNQDASGATVTLRDSTADDRVRAVIAVRLESGAGFFTIRPRLENPTNAPLNVKYWTNAMLAPGGPNAPSADLRFVLPDAVTTVTVHSRGDESLPNYGQQLSWPRFNGQDLSRLGNWNRWLGFFADPTAGGFAAVYDERHDEGMVRVFPDDVARGVKGFAFGWNDPIPAHNWTDDGSSYVEIHGGLAPTFDESVTLSAGGHLQWSETWYPVAGLGGLRYANAIAALNLAVGGGRAQVAVAVTRAWSGDLILRLDGQEIWRQGVSLVPGQSFRGHLPLGKDVPQAGRLALSLEVSGGTAQAEYGANFRLK